MSKLTDISILVWAFGLYQDSKTCPSQPKPPTTRPSQHTHLNWSSFFFFRGHFFSTLITPADLPQVACASAAQINIHSFRSVIRFWHYRPHTVSPLPSFSDLLIYLPYHYHHHPTYTLPPLRLDLKHTQRSACMKQLTWHYPWFCLTWSKYVCLCACVCVCVLYREE